MDSPLDVCLPSKLETHAWAVGAPPFAAFAKELALSEAEALAHPPRMQFESRGPVQLFGFWFGCWFLVFGFFGF